MTGGDETASHPVQTYIRHVNGQQLIRSCHNFHYSARKRQAKNCDGHVRLSVRSHEPRVQTPPEFSVHVICGRGSVLFWRRWDTLCISGYVVDVILSYDRPNGVRSYRR